MLGRQIKHFNRNCRMLFRRVSDSSTNFETHKTKPVFGEGEDDFFGFGGKNVVETGFSKSDNIQPLKKYENLFEKVSAPDEEKVFFASFGIIRYDSDNINARYTPPENNFIEEEYFRNYEDDNLQQDESYEDGDAFIEQQYFNSNSKTPINEVKERHTPNSEVHTKKHMDSYSNQREPIHNENDSTENYIENSYFNQQHTNKFMAKNETSSRKKAYDEGDEFGSKVSNNFETTDQTLQETKIEQSYKKERELAQQKKPLTAFDYALKRRKLLQTSKAEDIDESTPYHRVKAKQFDSKGFRILNQVRDLDELPEMMVVQLMKNSILYNENDIVAFNKPYGLPVQEGNNHRHYLTKYLPQLVKCVNNNNKDSDCTELYTVHRLDKETTGVLLLAKTQRMANILSELFADGKIIKTYWALTKNVPSPMRGIVDIPLYEMNKEGASKMMLKISYNEETKALVKKSSRKAYAAVTEYNVLAQHGNTALVELKPRTGVKHQLRVHLASGLGCPILGDHKYSHLMKLAPQKLPSDLLQRLEIRQSKVRHLPMHLHARGIAIPEIIEGRNIVIGARLPRHFSQNMKSLKLDPKSEL